MSAIGWTEIIIALGTALINGFFVMMSKRGATSSKKAAELASEHADRAVEASLRPRDNGHSRETEVDFNNNGDE